ncbi:tafazzin [Purpureocillium lavendulum]|uniref:Tafazzin n=1 Tax=Purpureocillium lavendulum TaxID=1247861 RepID=A0AB34FZ64_9HYPO|nr:tafazzin [Purpureocillium lavendulum]
MGGNAIAPGFGRGDDAAPNKVIRHCSEPWQAVKGAFDSERRISLDERLAANPRRRGLHPLFRDDRAHDIAPRVGMPKKRQHVKSFKPSSVASSSSSLSAPAAAADRPSKSVNELLANLRLASSAGSNAAPRELPAAAPSVPPAIRELLRLPETPPPLPRRPVRQRFDNHGRRLPAGPAPPRSWLSRLRADAGTGEGSSQPLSLLTRRSIRQAQAALPGAPAPHPGSLIDIVLRHLAVDWELHRIYNQYHLYFLPNHLKPALIRYVGLFSGFGVTLDDLKAILLPPVDVYDDDDFDRASATQVTCLDLTGSVGHSVKLKEVSDMLFPPAPAAATEEPLDSWDAENIVPSPPRALLPNLTHLSLALDPKDPGDASWKQLLSFSAKTSTVTHLSLAFWPVPCLAPQSRFASVKSPQGQSIPASGTNYYSHTLDDDWSEALLILRMLSKNLYKLEFLDLTGCASWFKALTLEDGHDFVDWAGSWGKVTTLRLLAGWDPAQHVMPSQQMTYHDALVMAGRVERHIVAQRAGKGRFITVERDRLD